MNGKETKFVRKKTKAEFSKIFSMTRAACVLIVCLAILSGCGRSSCIPTPDTSDVEIDVTVERLDRQLREARTRADIEALLDAHPAFKQHFLLSDQYPHDSVLVHRIAGLLQEPSMDSLFMEAERVFGDFDEMAEQFRTAFKIIKYYYPSFEPPTIKTVVTGMAHDMYVSDDEIIIGLDYYLGNEAKYRPVGIPEYIMKRFQKDYLVPQSMILFSNQFNATDFRDETALAEMIFYGKAYYFARQVVPCAADSLFTGYTSLETDDINTHEQVIWASLLENEVLYETSQFIKDKFLSERPLTLEIGERCPGRIGRWVGWQIVEEYAEENPEADLADIMQMSDAKEMFRASHYKPIAY
jgi:gliding motility-associated lipoprotein GldB